MDFNKKNISKYAVTAVIVLAVFGVGFFAGKSSVVVKACKPEQLDFSLFWDAYNKLHQNFLNANTIDDQKIIYGAIDGMTKSLGDPFTDFFDPDQAKSFQQSLQGSFEGIGVEVAIKKDQLTVIAPLKGTPGDKAGLKPGDVIVSINGKSTADMTTDDAVNLIRGPKGTSVTLSIFRDGWNEAKDFTIVRDTIKVNSIDWQLKNGDVAYIQIHQFDESLTADFATAVSQILKSPAKKIVLDLRGNPGGYLEVAQNVAGWLLKPGQTVTLEDFGKSKPQNIYKAEGNGALSGYPIVVLMDKGSASASEILAGALRDDRGVQLIGDQSFGKGSVQEVVNLQDGKSFLKITIAHWLTPKGNSIANVGLTPDVKVDVTDADIAAKNDPQLAKALEIIAGLK